MDELIGIAGKIVDKKLRKMVIDFIKSPSLSNKEFRYPAENIEKVRTPFSIGGTTVERDMLKHTIAVAELCLSTADAAEKNYGVKVNRDYLIAGALLHDIGKVFEWKVVSGAPEHTGIMLDHSILGVAELYARGFPEHVIHIVASHFGEQGPTPPRNFEALILHHVDGMLSSVEFYNNAMSAHMPMIVLDEEMIKKLKE
jgi:7,8-dihydroneopterin 2',3'-cyclic phosphate phosphodiesterase